MDLIQRLRECTVPLLDVPREGLYTANNAARRGKLAERSVEERLKRIQAHFDTHERQRGNLYTKIVDNHIFIYKTSRGYPLKEFDYVVFEDGVPVIFEVKSGGLEGMGGPLKQAEYLKLGERIYGVQPHLCIAFPFEGRKDLVRAIEENPRVHALDIGREQAFHQLARSIRYAA